jgi:hypothetical protein
MLKVPALSPPVPQVSSSSRRRVWITGNRWRMAAAIPAISSGVSPFMRRAIASAAICEGVASPARICSIAARACSWVRSSRSTTRPIADWIMPARSAAGGRG